jgi:hypothetical protein
VAEHGHLVGVEQLGQGLAELTARRRQRRREACEVGAQLLVDRRPAELPDDRAQLRLDMEGQPVVAAADAPVVGEHDVAGLAVGVVDERGRTAPCGRARRGCRDPRRGRSSAARGRAGRTAAPTRRPSGRPRAAPSAARAPQPRKSLTTNAAPRARRGSRRGSPTAAARPEAACRPHARRAPAPDLHEQRVVARVREEPARGDGAVRSSSWTSTTAYTVNGPWPF